MNHAALRYVIEQSPTTGAAWQVLVVIAYRADRHTGECYASRRRLATEARLSTSTIHQALDELLRRGEIEILLTGTGRRSTTYRITIPSDSLTEPKANGVVARFGDRSGSVATPVVARSASSSIGGREELEGFEGQSASAATVAADSTADAVGGDSHEYGRDWRTALNGQRPPSDARPVSAAAASAQQAAPDLAARRTRRGKRGTRGRPRDPPRLHHRSRPAACRPPVHHQTRGPPLMPTQEAPMFACEIVILLAKTGEPLDSEEAVCLLCDGRWDPVADLREYIHADRCPWRLAVAWLADQEGWPSPATPALAGTKATTTREDP